MKKAFIIIITVFILIITILALFINNAQKRLALSKKYNEVYTQYEGQEILGTDLISIINKAIDSNENNSVAKQNNTIFYEDNGINSIQIWVKFTESKENISMESIAEQTSENFIKFYATASFKCTQIEYHKKSNYVKSLLFEQVSQ